MWEKSNDYADKWIVMQKMIQKRDYYIGCFMENFTGREY